MPATLAWNPDLGILEVDLSGQLDKADYEQLGPEFDLLTRQFGVLRVLVTLTDFRGWTAKGLWEELKFDYNHVRDIDRLAIVGEKKWHSWMASFCKPFTNASVRYFENFEWDDAREWLIKESSRTTAARPDSPQEGDTI